MKNIEIRSLNGNEQTVDGEALQELGQSLHGTADVIDVVNFARKHNLLVSVRGGGHNVAGTTLLAVETSVS